MRRMVPFLMMWLAVAALPQPAHAGSWTASIDGGASVPTGDFGSENKANAQTGWRIGGAADYRWNTSWAFGVDAGWNQNTHGAEGDVVVDGSGNTSTIDQASFNVWSAGGHAKYFFPVQSQVVQWYGTMGAGFYGFTQKITTTLTAGGTPTTTEGEFSDKRAGMKLGFGGMYWANPQVAVGASLDYNIAFLDKDSSPFSSLQYMGINVGVTFNIPTENSDK